MRRYVPATARVRARRHAVGHLGRRALGLPGEDDQALVQTSGVDADEGSPFFDPEGDRLPLVLHGPPRPAGRSGGADLQPPPPVDEGSVELVGELLVGGDPSPHEHIARFGPAGQL